MVRGFALFGVLLVNMYNFGATSPIWTAPIDRAAFSIMRFFFETKSWRLFSFLFELGFTIQLLRAEARGGRFWPIYLRRLAWLFLIGLGHALLYDGDILRDYALLGLLLVPLRQLRPRMLLGVAIVLLAVAPVGGAVRSLVTQEVPAATPAPDIEAARRRNEERLRTHPYAVGSVGDVMAENAKSVLPNLLQYPLDLEGPAAYFAMFILGLYAGRRRIFHEIERHLPLIRSVAIWGLGLGILSMAAERTFAFAWGYDVWGERGANVPLELAGDVFFAYGSTALSLGYAAGIVLLSRAIGLRWLVRPLAPVGRLALTVYLTQSLAFTTLFYGYGFGRVGRLGPAGVTAYAVAIFWLQIAACWWWTRRYRFGPVEWAWRAGTYLRLPRMRLQG